MIICLPNAIKHAVRFFQRGDGAVISWQVPLVSFTTDRIHSIYIHIFPTGLASINILKVVLCLHLAYNLGSGIHVIH